jgi:hypothetical protein
MKKITTPEMEIALSTWFDYRTNLIVPNVHWGMNMHECDLLVVSKAGYCTEVEIKISRADLRADARKKHGHECRRIKYLYFAISDCVKTYLDLVPERAGIIIVSRSEFDPDTIRCKRVRDPTCQKYAPKMTELERYKVARLGALRIWGLKRKLL